MDDQMAEAIQRQMAAAQKAAFIDRTGWSDDQWIADAKRLMNELDGAVTSLVNGHVLALLRRVEGDPHDKAFYAEAFVLVDAISRFLVRKSTQRAIDSGLLDGDVVGPLIESNDRMWMIRTQRVSAARKEDN